MKMIEYIEPDDYDDVRIVRISEKSAIETMKDLCASRGDSYHHLSDDELLHSFMSIHWGKIIYCPEWERDENGNMKYLFTVS